MMETRGAWSESSSGPSLLFTFHVIKWGMCTVLRMPDGFVKETDLASCLLASRINETEHSTVRMMPIDPSMGSTSNNSINICIHLLDYYFYRFFNYPGQAGECQKESLVNSKCIQQIQNFLRYPKNKDSPLKSPPLLNLFRLHSFKTD